MKKLILLAAVIMAAFVCDAQYFNESGAFINGSVRTIHKTVYGEFRDGELVPFLKPTTVTLDLRINTAKGDIVTVTSRNPLSRHITLIDRIYADYLAILGDDDWGYVVMDTCNRVYLRLTPVGDTFILDRE
jgi:hypothetical protein